MPPTRRRPGQPFPALPSFKKKLQFAFSDKKNLRISMPMRRMGHLAGRQRGFMHVDVFAGGENAGDQPSHGPAVRQVSDRKLVVGKMFRSQRAGSASPD